jgi:hypothetical protein
MSHVGGDAHTFFMVYNMLYNGTKIIELNPVWKLESSEAIMKKMGRVEAFYVQKAVATPIWCPVNQEEEEDPMEVMIFCVSVSWIKERHDAIEGLDSDEHPHRISTYALLTSWFFKSISATIGLMLYNIRNQLQDCDINDFDAGTYQNLIPLTSVDYAMPQLIAKALEMGRRCGSVPPAELPRFQWRNSFSIAVNWADYYDAAVDLGDGLKETFQMLLYNTAKLTSLPNKLSAISLFTASRKVAKTGASKKLGAIVVAPKSVMTKVHVCGIMDGEAIYQSCEFSSRTGDETLTEL